MPLREAALRDRGLDAWLQLEQAERVGDRRAGPTDARCDRFLGEPELIDELAVGVCLLHRVEVGTLEVLDERELQLLGIRELTDDRRDPFEANEPVSLDRLGHENGLDDAVLENAVAEAPQRLFVDSPARLVGVRHDAANRDLDRSRRRRSLGDKGRQSAAQTLVPLGPLGFGGHAGTAWTDSDESDRPSRRRTSSASWR